VPAWLLDLLIVVGLGVLALLIRQQGLLTVPRFTDEQLDVLYTVPLYRGWALPIVAFDPYNGPLFSYLLAGLLRLLGPDPAVPRTLVMLVGVAAVVAAYVLGRLVSADARWSRLAGLVAAGLLATCAAHVVINSHVAWSNATTPFFTTLAFIALAAALRRRSGPLLGLSGLLLGVALQSHPSVIAFLPGVALLALIRAPSLALEPRRALGGRLPLPGRWALLAGALFLLGYANMIAYNLNPGLEAGYQQAVSGLVPDWRVSPEGLVGRLQRESAANAEASGSGLAAYPANLGALVLNLPRLAASLIEPPRSTALEYLAWPAFWLYAAVVLIGLLWPLRRGEPLPALLAGSFLLLLPIFNAKYEPVFNGRYLMPVLPLVFAGVGLAAADAAAAVGRLAPPRRWLAGLGLAAVLALLIGLPYWSLSTYLRRQADEGRINLDLLASIATIEQARRPGEPVVLDETLGRRNLVADGDLLQTLRVGLELRGVPYRIVAATPNRLNAELGPASGALLAVAQPYERGLEERFRLTEVEDRSGGRYAVYRLERR
jgi:4-amino-4-deoxy-L-arabinose transferase-like glycosyltransferase